MTTKIDMADARSQVLRCLAVYAVFAAMLLALNGCQSWQQGATDRDRYADAERAFSVAVDAATAAFTSGKLKGESLVLTKAALVEANAALIEMNRLLKLGQSIDADYWLGRAISAINAANGYMLTTRDNTRQG